VPAKRWTAPSGYVPGASQTVSRPVDAAPRSSAPSSYAGYTGVSTQSPEMAIAPAKTWQPATDSRRDTFSTSNTQLAPTVGHSTLRSAVRRHASQMKQASGSEQLTSAPATNSGPCEPNTQTSVLQDLLNIAHSKKWQPYPGGYQPKRKLAVTPAPAPLATAQHANTSIEHAMTNIPAKKWQVSVCWVLCCLDVLISVCSRASALMVGASLRVLTVFELCRASFNV
jgi:hypothetical protein